MTRDELIKFFTNGDFDLSKYRAGKIADFMLEDRRRICAPLIDWKKNHDIGKLEDVVDYSLKLAGLDKEQPFKVKQALSAKFGDVESSRPSSHG